jgi:hypothetical protein
MTAAVDAAAGRATREMDLVQDDGNVLRVSLE